MTENMQQIFMYLDTAAYAENPARRILFYITGKYSMLFCNGKVPYKTLERKSFSL